MLAVVAFNADVLKTYSACGALFTDGGAIIVVLCTWWISKNAFEGDLHQYRPWRSGQISLREPKPLISDSFSDEDFQRCSATVIIDVSVPNTPTNIQIRRTGLKKWSMSWNDTSDCRDSPDYIYRVHIYVDRAPEVIERTFRSRSITVTKFDPCILTWIQVKCESPDSIPALVQLYGGWDASVLNTDIMLSMMMMHHSVPNTPTNIQIRRTGLKKWSMSWNDTSDCRDSPDYIYRVHIYVDGAPEVIERTLRSRSTTVTNIDPCKLTWIRVMAVGAGGESPMSDPMKLTGPPAPQTPTNIQVQTNQNSHEFSATWEDNSECLSPQGPYYAVGVYDGKDQLVLEKSVTEKSAPLGTFDACSAFWLRVSTIGVVEVSAPSNAVRITDPPLPSAPKLIGATTELNVPSATVSWTYDGTCTSTDFLVTVYATAGSVPEPVRASGLSTSIGGLPMCVDLVFGVVGRNQFGSGQETKSSPIRIDAVAPSTIRVKLRPNEDSATVSWKYRHTCPVESFQVSLYDADGLSLRTVNTNDREVYLDDLPVNVPLLVDVLGRNYLGNGPRSERVQFFLPRITRSTQLKALSYREPRRPINIVVSVLRGRTEVNVSWTVANSRTISSFTAKLYNGSSVIQQQTTEYLNTSFRQVDPCSSWTVGRRLNEDSATVSWKYRHTCPVESFQVSLYDADGLSLRTVNTNDREVYLDDLPVNVPLLVDVLGRNYLGNGPRSERVQFFLPRITRSTQLKALSYREPRRPINIVVSVLRGRTEVNVSWTVANSRTISSFTAKLYNGSSVIQQQTTEYLNTSFRQVDPCSSWTVGVIAHNAHGTGEEWFTKEFRIPADSFRRAPNILSCDWLIGVYYPCNLIGPFVVCDAFRRCIPVKLPSSDIDLAKVSLNKKDEPCDIAVI
ncbi:hypothetical protein CLF_111564, partial [Clonorchis sinensis]